MRYRLLLPLLLVALSAQAQTPTEAAINLRTIRMKSAVMNEERTILVRTPAGYENQPEVRFPVLYLTDGDTHLGHTAATVEFLARNGRMPEMIIVGVTNTDRTRDLTPTKGVTFREGPPQMNLATAGGADRFLDFFEKELIPAIDKSYRTHPYRVFAGHSFGGLFAIHALATRPHLFQSFIAVSPALTWDDNYAEKRLTELISKKPDLRASLFVTLGNEGEAVTRSFRSIETLLKSRAPKGLDWKMELMEADDHGSTVLLTHYNALRRIYAGWQMPRNPDGIFAGGLEAADAHYAGLSERFGYRIPTPEGVVNLIGYQLMNERKMPEAIGVFKANVARHPESANVHDSLGEAYERSGQLELARASYGRAVEIGKKTKDQNLEIFRANHARVMAKGADAAAAN